MIRADWVANRVREFASLRGHRIRSWTGVEMALRERAAAGGPQFEDSAVPCLQLLSLHASLDDAVVAFGTYQDNDVFGLRIQPAANGEQNHWHGIFRSRPLAELPIGQVDRVSVFLDEEAVAEVLLHVDARPLLLMAGELYESMQGKLQFHRFDESILAFTQPSAAETVDWIPPRHDLVPAPDKT